MSINIGPPAIEELRPKISVFGVGGAGGNAIANMIRAAIEGVDFIVANTDAQALNASIAAHRIQLGPDITQGLGAGSRPEVGRAAAEETMAEIERALEGTHMCFIAAGMGGGTGTGAAPVIAKAARDKGVLTVGVVTKPFLFEGTRRMRSAEAGIEELQKHVDTLIVIPNQNLFLVAKAETTFKEAFELADEVLQQGVRSITDLMIMPGLINLDFADVRSVMAEMGKAMMGTGEGTGENRALEAAEKAIANPLLDGVSMQGAKGVIISIIGGEDMKLLEIDEAANHIRELVDPQANIIWGSAFNSELQGKIRVSVVATGIDQAAPAAEAAPRSFALPGARGPARPSAKKQALAEAAEPGSMPEPTPVFAAPPAAEPLATPTLEAKAVAAAKPANADWYPGGDVPPPFAAPLPRTEPPAEPAPFVEPLPGPDYGAPRSARAEKHEVPLDLELSQATEEPSVPGAAEPWPAPQPVDVAAADPAVGGPVMGSRRRGLVSGTSEESASAPQASSPASQAAAAPPPPQPVAGGTLFERMANLAGRRKSADDEDDGDDGGAVNIPRFLGRQNNQ